MKRVYDWQNSFYADIVEPALGTYGAYVVGLKSSRDACDSSMETYKIALARFPGSTGFPSFATKSFS